MKTKEKLRNCHRPEETKETRLDTIRRLIAVWFSALDPGQKIDTNGKTVKI